MNRIEFTKISSLFSSEKQDKIAQKILTDFDSVIQGVRPLNSKQLLKLPENIKALSHQLTDQRSERRLGYMNDTLFLSSYVRYYTWWNLVRLTKLFSNLDDACFPSKDCYCLDLGSGPLTVINALWLSRPELRKLNLTWYCLDVSANSLSLGEDIFLSLAAKTAVNENSGNEIKPWKIIRVKGSFGTFIREKCSFITCANLLNELDQASDLPPDFQSKKYYEEFKKYSSADAKFLLIEPGIPKASRTLSLLRERFIKDKATIHSPCTHFFECPMNGFKAYTGSSHKWCNFAFSTEDAPPKLLKLSEKSYLSKDRATLSFLAVEKTSVNQDDTFLIRIVSDSFSLPDRRSGFYGCSKLGLTLVSTKEDIFKSGDLISVKLPENYRLPKDSKSGAVLIRL